MPTLTQTAVTRLQPRQKRYVEWDPTRPGFGVRVSTAGRKTYVVKYRHPPGRDGVQRVVSLGPATALTLADARAQARAILGDVAKGQDPLVGRDAQREAPTVRKAVSEFLEAIQQRTWRADRGALSRNTVRSYRAALEHHFCAKYGSRRIADITAVDMEQLHRDLREATPMQANQTLAAISSLMRWAERPRLDGRPAYRPRHSNPCHDVTRVPQRPRTRYLTTDEREAIYGAMDKLEAEGTLEPPQRTMILLAMYTGARIGEITSLRWDEIDLEAGKVHLADSKTGAKTIFLNASAVELLRDWPHESGSPFVFPASRDRSTTGHRCQPSKAWRAIRERAQIPDVRLHDLRHSFASELVSSGHPLTVIGALLGHRQPSTTARYAHLYDDTLHAAAASVGQAIAKKTRPS